MNRRTMMGAAAGLVAGVAGSVHSASAEEKSGEVCCAECCDCVESCLACVDSCLNEAGRAACIKLCLDCADVCDACMKVSARKGPMAAALMALCADAGDRCAAECEKHKDDEACKKCAEQCRACAKRCRALAKSK